MNIIVIATHPDDETLGCGGALFKHAAKGDKVFWLIVTAMKKECGYNDAQIMKREGEIKSVNKKYGFAGIYQLEYPTTRLDAVPLTDLIKRISSVFDEVKPDIVYLPFYGDVHSDHGRVFDAAYSCTKIFRRPTIKKILMMETLSETEYAPPSRGAFIPNYFVDITDHYGDKLEALKLYGGEMKPHPFPRSEENISALATLRGSMAGCKYAEAFMLLKAVR